MISNKKNLVLFYSDVQDGNMSLKYDDVQNVKKNKSTFFKSVNILERNTFVLDILYSDIILDVKSRPNSNCIRGDAVITSIKDIYFYLAFGDCIPFVVYDNKKSILAFAHLGWQSICKNLHLKVIEHMKREYSSNLSDLEIFFGPSITKESYAFDNPAQLTMPEWKKYIFRKDDLYHIDLHGYIIAHIKDMGVKNENIYRTNINTATDEKFFSHYRSTHFQEKEGRFIFGVGIKSENVE